MKRIAPLRSAVALVLALFAAAGTAAGAAGLPAAAAPGAGWGGS